VRTQAQESSSQPGSQQPGTPQPNAQPQQSPQSQPSSSSQSSSSTQGQGQGAQTPQYGVYLSVDPLEKVRYDNRWDLSLGAAYDHMKAGPTILRGSNLGGLDMEGSYWLNRNWGIVASGRGYIGTAEPAPSGPIYLKGAVVKQYFFVGGAEWLGPHNKHGALIAHALFGGVYGNFEKDLLGKPPGLYDFYYNQLAPAAIIGGHFDLNRSEHWVFRVTPDAVMTHYTYSTPSPAPASYSQFDVNFAISVGLEYKFTSIKRSTRKANWVSGW
jgi:hypothetical protein